MYICTLKHRHFFIYRVIKKQGKNKAGDKRTIQIQTVILILFWNFPLILVPWWLFTLDGMLCFVSKARNAKAFRCPGKKKLGLALNGVCSPLVRLLSACVCLECETDWIIQPNLPSKRKKNLFLLYSGITTIVHTHSHYTKQSKAKMFLLGLKMQQQKGFDWVSKLGLQG